ncbi:efflux RND transporter periplasmic adaptor subunit [Patescibacteria group bacterium]|nr:efflux RND transporter periplasmic adaptor subunit [Patescibacteria group bacterium]
MNKKIISIIIIILVIIFGVYQGFIKKEKPFFTLTEVYRGIVSQEVSETGTVKKGEEINLSFKAAGRIEKIYVKVGDKIESNTALAKLDTSQLSIQLQEARAALLVAQAQLDKLLAGASAEEIKIAETEVKNSQIALDTTKENLDQAFEDAIISLDDSYLKLYNASNIVESIRQTYFNTTDQESLEVKENEVRIENAVSRAKSYLDIAKDNPEDENIDVAFSEMKKALDTTSKALAIIRETCEAPVYRNTVSSTDKTSLDTQRTNINTALTNITNSQQTISSMKLNMEAAEGQLQKAEDQLALVMAKPQKEDIDLYEAQIKQTQAQINLIENQIEEATIISPTEGQITKTNKEIGEMVQPSETVISFISASPFQIKADIYEEDVVKINVDNSVDIILTAFPDEILKGKVVLIDPAEKLIEGVVYYEVTIDFEETRKGIKPGMTADIVIRTASKENVLIIPEVAIQTKDDKTIVEVFKNGQIEEREIKIGLLGSDDMVEVISGLKEGEEVAIK